MNNLIYSNNKFFSSSCSPNFENQKKKKNKTDFKKLKNNTINSLNEVECFLTNFNKFTDYIKLYKILK